MKLSSKFSSSLLHRWLEDNLVPRGQTMPNSPHMLFAGLLHDLIIYSSFYLSTYTSNVLHNYCVPGSALTMKTER